MSRDPASRDFRTNTVPEDDIAAATAETAGSPNRIRRSTSAAQRLFPELEQPSDSEAPF
jgi:hypothetical protein